MEDSLTQLGVGAVFSLLVLRTVFDFLRSRRTVPDQDRLAERIEKIERLTQELHDWHAIEDVDGVKRWHCRSGGLEKTQEQIGRALEVQCEVMRAVLDEVKDMRRDADRPR